MALTQTVLYRVLPLDEAVHATGWSEEQLRKGIEAGTIVASVDGDGTLMIVVTPQGQPLQVSPVPPENGHEDDNGHGDDLNTRLSRIKREDFAHLEGQPITVSEAARKYEVPAATIHTWIHRGYLTPLGKVGRQRQINEADIAFCAAIYHVRKPFGSRAPLLDKEGRPYLIKYPDLAKARRRSSE